MSSAVGEIAGTAGIQFDPGFDVASLYETSPVGISGQNNYLNSVFRLRASITPRDLLELLLSIELSHGRVRSERWASRTIDLDLLLYDDLILDEPDLAIPHPRMHERSFVLEPLAELAPDVLHPVMQETVKELAENARLMCPLDRIQRISGPEWVGAAMRS